MSTKPRAGARPPKGAGPAAHGPTPTDAALRDALGAFDANDVSVWDALQPGVADFDRAKVMKLRDQGTVVAGEAIEAHLREAGITAPMLHEQAAMAYTSAGAHAQALSVRLTALPRCARYDSWGTSFALTNIARSLRALERHDDALFVAERAQRFQPLEPTSLVVLAAARAAVGDDDGAARVRAWLFDRGVGPCWFPGTPTDRDRAAEAYEVDWAALEPMSDEDMGRYLVFSRADVVLVGTLAAGRGRLAAQARHGDWSATKSTCSYYRDGSPTFSDAGLSLGLPITFSTEYAAMTGLIDAVTERAKREKSVKPADVTHRLAGVRAHTIRELAASGGTVPRASLTDLIWDVARAAGQALPDDPVTAAARASEEDPRLTFGARVFSGEPLPHQTPHTIGATDYVLRDGAKVTYPVGRTKPDEWAPVLERAESGRAKCKVCKAAIAAGELRMDVRSKLFPVEHAYVHVACAPNKKKFATLLKQAQARSRFTS
ncbi:MAG: hypothetical protein KC668_22190 [Myxococcales bacterium]|nr:hypothetical protein [Myxococcales bacterium]